MRFRPLHGNDFDAVHRAFLDAFSEYAVPLQLTAAQLGEMLRRRGYVPAASIGVFDDDRLVAFTLNGIGDWRGERTGYDTGTGVVPSHRGRGLSSEMIEASLELLRAQGATQYLLEVLTSNAQACHVYRNAGFEVVRELQCWAAEGAERVPAPRVAVVGDVDWQRAAEWFDVASSWQNSIDSIRRASAPRTILAAAGEGLTVGFAVVFEGGDLPLLAIAPHARRRGIGRELLAAASRTAGGTLRIVNVEDDYGAEFLEACGATRTVRQLEMVRRICFRPADSGVTPATG